MKRIYVIAVWALVTASLLLFLFVFKDELIRKFSLLFSAPASTSTTRVVQSIQPLPSGAATLLPAEQQNIQFVGGWSAKGGAPSQTLVKASSTLLSYRGIIRTVDTSAPSVSYNPIANDKTIVSGKTYSTSLRPCNNPATNLGIPTPKGEDIEYGTDTYFAQFIAALQPGQEILFECTRDNFTLLTMSCASFATCASYPTCKDCSK